MHADGKLTAGTRWGASIEAVCLVHTQTMQRRDHSFTATAQHSCLLALATPAVYANRVASTAQPWQTAVSITLSD
jgi:hypothetical protein